MTCQLIFFGKDTSQLLHILQMDVSKLYDLLEQFQEVFSYCRATFTTFIIRACTLCVDVVVALVIRASGCVYFWRFRRQTARTLTQEIVRRLQFLLAVFRRVQNVDVTDTDLENNRYLQVESCRESTHFRPV
jgi:hypothetical protein